MDLRRVVDFKFVQLFSSCKERSDEFHALYMSDWKLKVYDSFLILKITMDFCLIMVCAFIYFNCLGNENKVPYIEVHHVIIYNILTKAYMDFEKESM